MIPREFFTQDPVVCARALVGAELVWGACRGIVVECEAYSAVGDPASHTFSRPSARKFIAHHPAGVAYVYFNYGMHWMLNVLVKGAVDGFVLLRAIEPTRGIPAMMRRRGGRSGRELTGGPGRLSAALGVTGRDHGRDFCSSTRRGFIARNPEGVMEIIADGRIGISRAKDYPWRFSIAGNSYVSVPPKKTKPRKSIRGLA